MNCGIYTSSFKGQESTVVYKSKENIRRIYVVINASYFVTRKCHNTYSM